LLAEAKISGRVISDSLNSRARGLPDFCVARKVRAGSLIV